MSRKRKRASTEPVDPAEAARRKRQAELRALALKLRAEGKDYVSWQHKPKKDRQAGQSKDGGAAGGHVGAGGHGHEAKHYLGDKTPGWRPFDNVQVIVLPIFWNFAKEEKDRVIAAAERCVKMLQKAGLSVDMDATNKYTPGQKMKYWETMGVRVRVEVGPRDVANGNAVVARARAPGEVATKSVVSMAGQMVTEVQRALAGQESLVAPEPEWTPGGSGGGGKHMAFGAQEQQQAGDEEGDEEQEQHEEGDDEGEGDEPAAKPHKAGTKGGKAGDKDQHKERGKAADENVKKSKKAKQEQHSDDAGEGGKDDGKGAAAAGGGARAKKAAAAVAKSADADEDDFGELIAFEAEEDKLVLSKAERLQKQRKLDKERRRKEKYASRGGAGGRDDGDGHGDGDGDDGEGEDGFGGATGSERKKKKAKLVVF